VFRRGNRGPEVRPFSQSAEVECRGCSEPLQRAIVDFGADAAGTRIPEKLKQHYGIEVPASTCWQIVLRHAAAIAALPRIATEIPRRDGVEQLIAEIDGSMIPIVETAGLAADDGHADRRKTRTVCWKEARLSLVHPKGSVTPVFSANMGTPEEAGDDMLRTAIRAGLGSKTKVHCVGDGATWIADQVSLKFGAQASFLVDFYHVCEYLADAATTIAPAQTKAWINIQKHRLKHNALNDLLSELALSAEPGAIADPDAPVRAACRYFTNRPGQFDYAKAIAAELPIGSGEVESAHRYVIQARLKIAGAWWKTDNATNMLSMRALRANRDWDHYWTSRKAA
jgi:hypothetical protein